MVEGFKEMARSLEESEEKLNTMCSYFLDKQGGAKLNRLQLKIKFKMLKSTKYVIKRIN